MKRSLIRKRERISVSQPRRPTDKIHAICIIYHMGEKILIEIFILPLDLQF